jgi:catechol 2,3-dioxygenase-like lactoylglutathione lyase family enzyme
MTPTGVPPLGAVLESCLYASPLDDSARFYEEVLGLEVFAKVPGRHVFFRAGAGMFLLFDPSGTEQGGDVPPHGARGPGHIAFAVATDDLPDWRKRLERAEVEIEAELEWPRGGGSLYIRDPAGNSVELASPKIWGLPEDRTSSVEA